MLFPKPILVTGAHRSGSTWIGKVLSVAPDTRYIHEPFNLNQPVADNPVTHWHEIVNNTSDKQKQKHVHEYLRYFYAAPKRYLKEEYRKLSDDYTLRDAFWVYRQRIQNRTIIKDPLAVFAAQWIYQNINCNVLVSVRHPAAFVASLKVKNWNTSFQEFLHQPEINYGIYKKYLPQIEEYAQNQPDVITTGIFLWNIIYDVVSQYKAEYGQMWVFVKHEDLSRNPMEEFSRIFDRLGLCFNQDVEQYIQQTTQKEGASDFERNAQKNITTWKERLTADEIDQIQKQTEPVWTKFYTDQDW